MLLKMICEPLWISYKKPLPQQRFNRRLSVAFFGCFAFSVCLAELYQFGVYFFNILPWQSALIVHAFMACVLFFREKNAILQQNTLILCGLFMALQGVCYTFAVSIPLWMLTWIPLVEEWVFRRGLGSTLQNYLRNEDFSLYLQGVTFSFLHSWPTINRVSSFDVGLVPGALFLGILTGIVFRKTKSLMTIVGLHSMGNLGAWILARAF